MIGYLVHEYNDPSVNKAIILMDEVISDNPEGGTGKGIVMNALSHMREMVIQDGKNFSFSTQFRFQDVSHSTSILTFDDVKRNFNVERLFSALTDGLSVEQKGLKRFRISKEDIPKTLINTNYVINGSGNSHERRRCEFEFSQHYNGDHTPLDEFDKLFFSEWEEDQWNLFDNFIVRCVQFYLEKGLIQVEPVNLEQKKIHSETCIEFVEFISNYKTNKKYNRSELMELFEMEYPEISGERWYTNRKFISWLRVYAKHKGYDYEESRATGGVTFFIYHEEVVYTKDEEKKLEEMREKLNSKEKRSDEKNVNESDPEIKKKLERMRQMKAEREKERFIIRQKARKKKYSLHGIRRIFSFFLCFLC